MRRAAGRRLTATLGSVAVVGVSLSGAGGLRGAGGYRNAEGLGGATTSTSSTTTSPPSSSTTASPSSFTTAPPAGAATPVLSVRRVPRWVETTVSDQRLVAHLPTAMAVLKGTARTSCLLVRRGGRTLFAENARRPEVPASNLKLLTATAAVDKLGPKTRLRTRVLAAGPVRHGVLLGNLYLVGGGDPVLRASSYVPSLVAREPAVTWLPDLARQVRRAGIRAVAGRVLGDGTLFDDRRGVPGWPRVYLALRDYGPLGALAVNDGYSPTKPYAPADDPAAMTAGVFAKELRADGVAVRRGSFGAGAAPRSARPVASILSPTVAAMVSEILQASDDTGAELLAKLLGARFRGAGTTAAGTAVIRADLARRGLPTSQLRNVDGSGLDRRDRVTCNLVADTLQQDGTSGPIFDGLPVAGRTGTLAGRLVGTDAQGRVHAKTGTLGGVAALSGWVMPPKGDHGPPILFAFVANAPQDTKAVGDYLGVLAGDAIARQLAADPRPLPPLGAVGPVGAG